jgi:hypothetical protein
VKPWFETKYTCPEGSSQTFAVIHSLSSGIPVTTTKSLGALETGSGGAGGGEGGHAPSVGKVATEVMYLTTVGIEVSVATSTAAGGFSVGVGGSKSVIGIVESLIASKTQVVNVIESGGASKTKVVSGIASHTGTGGLLVRPSPIASTSVFTGSAARMEFCGNLVALAGGLLGSLLL